jgi:uncharacterized repeat protein (TIGR03803 family)
MHWHTAAFRKFLILTTFICVFCVAVFAQQTATPTITALFKFTCNGNLCSNGFFPKGKLVQAQDGNFYGATSSGGRAPGSGGTIFQITPTGVLTTLFSFDSDGNGQFPNGETPLGSLVQGPDGFLYGATTLGGKHGAGTVFKISTGGNFRLLHSFCSLQNCADGSSPTSLTVGTHGNLYGATVSGGRANSGTIFRITTRGVLRTIHSLNGKSDSGSPNALTPASDGNFYATTDIGPTGLLGTIFRVTPSGVFTTLHDFSSPPDADPMGPLLQASDGRLYGVTLYGEIYQSTLTGSFEIIVPAPFDPVRSGLTQASDGNLWETHQGSTNTDPGDVFAVTLAGQQVRSARFSCKLNGGTPQGVIQATDGKLYGVGTSCIDGSGVQHFGTVFVVDAGLSTPGARGD